ncbi:peptidoglycan DD-metalloendopeptidase family protein [Bathymodiolus japonicus methanotrophic gill symbiont]|uniref:peptidoglycan DD-metalloendopeptidase family protein n=1 Tax=Bathymodiolus japonicus methanotrophic gill symbiont TaxID=113269 RepID=UPI0021E10004|nr:M23 family metallopeptidase [Bathymodiolus japonicus methanotrophic gill symbiont]
MLPSQYQKLEHRVYSEVGEWVNAGDTIATLGNSVGRNKAGLYFEIRKKNRPLNPKKWRKKR